MPLPPPEIKGLGYVSHEELAVEHGPDVEPMSDDSDISSTSLVRSLIDPSQIQMEFRPSIWSLESDALPHYSDNFYGDNFFSFFKQQRRMSTGTTAFDIPSVRSRREVKEFQKQLIPKVNQSSIRWRRLANTYSREDWGMDAARSASSIGGMVGDIVTYMDHQQEERSNARTMRALHLNLYKEQLEMDKEVEDLVKKLESKSERMERKRKMELKKAKENEILKRHSKEEREAIKEALGDLVAMDEPVFFPYGKKRLSDMEEEPENFFELINKISETSLGRKKK